MLFRFILSFFFLSSNSLEYERRKIALNSIAVAFSIFFWETFRKQKLGSLNEIFNQRLFFFLQTKIIESENNKKVIFILNEESFRKICSDFKHRMSTLNHRLQYWLIRYAIFILIFGNKNFRNLPLFNSFCTISMRHRCVEWKQVEATLSRWNAKVSEGHLFTVVFAVRHSSWSVPKRLWKWYSNKTECSVKRKKGWIKLFGCRKGFTAYLM